MSFDKVMRHTNNHIRSRTLLFQHRRIIQTSNNNPYIRECVLHRLGFLFCADESCIFVVIGVFSVESVENVAADVTRGPCTMEKLEAKTIRRVRWIEDSIHENLWCHIWKTANNGDSMVD